MAVKHRVYINDHGVFTLFGMNVTLPAILDLTEEQITYINNSGLYKISELTSIQKTKAKQTLLSEVEGDRFEHSRSISVNELSYRTPIMATKYKEKAKNSMVLKRNSSYLNDIDAIRENKKQNAINNKSNDNKNNDKSKEIKINNNQIVDKKKEEIHKPIIENNTQQSSQNKNEKKESK